MIILLLQILSFFYLIHYYGCFDVSGQRDKMNETINPTKEPQMVHGGGGGGRKGEGEGGGGGGDG
jgi:hypothetical protein